MDNLQVTFLEMNEQPPTAIAHKLAAFLHQARQSIDIAAYAFHFSGPTAAIVTDALRERAAQGVKIRIVYNADGNTEQTAQGGSHPYGESGDFIAGLGYPAHPVHAWCCLMHQKYIVLDAGTPAAQVWTGSTNFTDDSWSLQENNILTIASAALAAGYARDFEELWVLETTIHTGEHDSVQVALRYKDRPADVQVHFAPGEGKWLDHEIAVRVENAREQVTVCAAVITSGHILSALSDLMQRGVPIAGIYDRTQMEEVQGQWRQVQGNHWKIPAFANLVDYGRLAGKVTTPWTPSSVHDFMHNKVLVVDDTVITGSYNFSRNAQTNAENVLIIDSPALAADYRAYIAHLVARYGAEDERGPHNARHNGG